MAWDICYKHLDEFSNAPFKQFKERLADHRDRLIDQLDKMEEEEEAMVRDRQRFPKKTHNHRGEPAFCYSPAMQLLRQDVIDGVHKRMTIKHLQASRIECTPFKPKKFKERIYQEIRCQKFIYHLELKRTLKEKERRSKVPSQSIVNVNNNNNNNNNDNNIINHVLKVVYRLLPPLLQPM